MRTIFSITRTRAPSVQTSDSFRLNTPGCSQGTLHSGIITAGPAGAREHFVIAHSWTENTAVLGSPGSHLTWLAALSFHTGEPRLQDTFVCIAARVGAFLVRGKQRHHRKWVRILVPIWWSNYLHPFESSIEMQDPWLWDVNQITGAACAGGFHFAAFSHVPAVIPSLWTFIGGQSPKAVTSQLPLFPDAKVWCEII